MDNLVAETKTDLSVVYVEMGKFKLIVVRSVMMATLIKAMTVD
jgi:hypothetical protein